MSSLPPPLASTITIIDASADSTDSETESPELVTPPCIRRRRELRERDIDREFDEGFAIGAQRVEYCGKRNVDVLFGDSPLSPLSPVTSYTGFEAPVRKIFGPGGLKEAARQRMGIFEPVPRRPKVARKLEYPAAGPIPRPVPAVEAELAEANSTIRSLKADLALEDEKRAKLETRVSKLMYELDQMDIDWPPCVERALNALMEFDL